MTLVVQNNHPDRPAGRTALAACATLDGMVGATIWARRLGLPDSFLFTPEGQTGALFGVPALVSLPNLERLCCFNLPLTPGDLAPLQTLLDRQTTLRDRNWIDNHFMHPEHVAFFRENDVQLLLDTSARWASTGLLQYLGPGAAWEEELVAALDAGPAEAPPPWNDWLTVMLAVMDEIYTIRHALHPLIEERFAAYDPALLEAGRNRLRRVKELSGSVNHEVTVKGVKVVVIGLPPSEQSSYRLIADTILGDAEGDLGLIFFDGINRLVLRSAKRRPATVDLLRIGEWFAGQALQVYHYDLQTIFIAPEQARLQCAIEKTLEILQTNLAAQ